MIRVGFLVPTLGRAGGTETWHRMLIKGLDRSQIEVIGICCLESYDREIYDQWADVCRVEWDNHGLLNGCLDPCDIIVTWAIDCPQNFIPNWHNPKIVMVAHGDAAFPEFAQFNHNASPWVDHYVAVSNAAVAAIPADRHKDTTIIPNGIDFERLKPTLTRNQQRADWNVPRDAKVLGMVGRLSHEKDPKALTRAISCLPEEWVGVAIGDGPDMLDCIADSFASGTRCFYPGADEDIGSCYGAMDCLLSASLSEGFGYVALEAMAAGVPVVATPVGILAEDSWTTHLCPDVSVEPHSSGKILAEAVLRATAPSMKPQYKVLGMMAIEKHYSAEAFCRNWTNYLTRLQCSTPQPRSTKN